MKNVIWSRQFNVKLGKKGAIKIAFALFVLLIPLFFVFAGFNQNKNENIVFAANQSESEAEMHVMIAEQTQTSAADYKKPEFYPTYGYYKDKQPPEDRVGVWGIGMYPASHTVNVKQNGDFNVTSYIHTSWFVRTYQGIALYAKYDENYFDIQMEDNIFLLGHSYPQFDENWAHRINVRIKVNNAPKGTHEIVFYATAPPADIEREWSEKYKNYVSAPPVSPDQPYLVITVNVD